MLYIYPDVGIGEVDLTALGLIHSRIHTSLLPSLVPPKAADINLPGAFLNAFRYKLSDIFFSEVLCFAKELFRFIKYDGKIMDIHVGKEGEFFVIDFDPIISTDINDEWINYKNPNSDLAIKYKELLYEIIV